MKLLWILFPFLLSGQEAFISHYEYGEMLYENPRGISCLQCHGDLGEGRIILEYQEGEEKKILRGADIRNMTLSSMVIAVNSYHKVMPRYYLTDKEVKAIHDYLKVKNSL
jgi:mono/diheme cytochrome c family protein